LPAVLAFKQLHFRKLSDRHRPLQAGDPAVTAQAVGYWMPRIRGA
jgi:hypothetical protein